MRSLKTLLVLMLVPAFSLGFALPAGPGDEHGFDLANLELSVNACVNFDGFADGG